jgi:hypothetical protein
MDFRPNEEMVKMPVVPESYAAMKMIGLDCEKLEVAG